MCAIARLKLRPLACIAFVFLVAACGIAPRAFGQKASEVTVKDMAAFSFNLATGPSEKGSPYLLKLIGYSNPNECFEKHFCKRVRLFLAIIGDGEAPDYKVYELGEAVDWQFKSWGNAPSRYFDDERDKFTFVLNRVDVCRPPKCKAPSLSTTSVKGEVSLWGFRWIE